MENDPRLTPQRKMELLCEKITEKKEIASALFNSKLDIASQYPDLIMAHAILIAICDMMVSFGPGIFDPELDENGVVN